MKTFTFKSPEGKTYTIQAPDNATPEQAKQFFAQKMNLGAPAQPAAPQAEGLGTQLARQVKPTLQLGGTVAGGIIGAGAGLGASAPIGGAGAIPGGLAGAAAGRALGTAAGNVFNQVTGLDRPQTLGEGFKEVGTGAVQGAAEQATGLGSGAAITAAGKAVFSGVSKATPTVFKLLGNIPEKITQWAQKGGFKAPLATEEDVAMAAKNVKDSLDLAKANAGSLEAKARGSLGIDDNFEAVLGSIKQKPMTPQQLVDKYNSLKGELDIKSMKPEAIANRKEYAKQLVLLREQIKEYTSFAGGKAAGLTSKQINAMDSAYNAVNKRLDAIPEAAALRQADAQMNKVLEVIGDMRKAADSPGQLEAYVRRIFTGQTPQAREQRELLATIEQVTGQPVITDLFTKMTGQEFSKFIGRPIIAQIASTGLVTSPITNPVMGLTSAAMLAGQSPRMLGALGRAGSALGRGARTVAPNIAPVATGGFALGDIRAQNMTELEKVKARINARPNNAY